MSKFKVLLVFVLSGIVPLTRLHAQSKQQLHPFIEWEIREIVRIDSIWQYDDHNEGNESSFTDPEVMRFREVEGWLADSIENLPIVQEPDVKLVFQAIDTLMYSDLSNAALSYWELSVTDHVLNKVYKLVMNSFTDEEKVTLREDEHEWLKKRDAFFKKEDRYEVKNDGTMFVQIGEDIKADFVRKRVLSLAKKLR